MIAFNPKLTITNRMTAAITQIERARGFLEAARLSDDWVRDMGNKALIKEAHHTTHIEGTQLTLDQAERLWNGEKVPEADPEDTRELLNYRSAFEFVSECLDSGDPITEGLIREIHRKLVEGVRGGKADPGNYRRIQNYVANSSTGEVIYTPPSAVDVPILMSEMVKWLNADFEIHPVLISGIASVRENGMDMTVWLDYFITGLETQMIEVKKRGEQIIRRDVLVRKHGLNERQGKAIEFLLGHGKLTIQNLRPIQPVTMRYWRYDKLRHGAVTLL